MNKAIFIAPIIAILLGAIPSALADQNGYIFTVHVPNHAFGVDAVTIFLKTANGYTAQQDVSTAQNEVHWTFVIPPNQGDTIQVCTHTAGVLGFLNQDCQLYNGINQEIGRYHVSQDSP